MIRLLSIAVLFVCSLAHAQYTPSAGQNAPMVERQVEFKDSEGRTHVRVERERAPSDSFGNAAGSAHDLAVDGAFEGQTVAVLHFYAHEGFDFSLPKQALKEKGFSVYRWVNQAPSPEELAKALKKSNQLWLISDGTRKLNAKHLKVIKEFFDSGHGVYIWGDNEPYYADANYVAEALLGTKMLGNLIGNQTVGLQKEPGTTGVLRRHLLTTGLEYLYEGITIATIQPNERLTPLLYGSAGNLVAAFHDRDGKRAILDGGFTRLYVKWDTAGTGRYVKNAAAWLANVERFGDAVVAERFKRDEVIAPH